MFLNINFNEDNMKIIAVIISIISLGACITIPFISFFGVIDFGTYLLWFNIASLLWFISAPIWLTPGLFKGSAEKVK